MRERREGRHRCLSVRDSLFLLSWSANTRSSQKPDQNWKKKNLEVLNILGTCRGILGHDVMRLDWNLICVIDLLIPRILFCSTNGLSQWKRDRDYTTTLRWQTTLRRKASSSLFFQTTSRNIRSSWTFIHSIHGLIFPFICCLEFTTSVCVAGRGRKRKDSSCILIHSKKSSQHTHKHGFWKRNFTTRVDRTPDRKSRSVDTKNFSCKTFSISFQEVRVRGTSHKEKGKNLKMLWRKNYIQSISIWKKKEPEMNQERRCIVCVVNTKTSFRKEFLFSERGRISARWLDMSTRDLFWLGEFRKSSKWKTQLQRKRTMKWQTRMFTTTEKKKRTKWQSISTCKIYTDTTRWTLWASFVFSFSLPSSSMTIPPQNIAIGFLLMIYVCH